MPANAARKTEPKIDVAALTREYLELERKISPEREREGEIKTLLVAKATQDGGFREVVAGLGHLTVSGNKTEEFKGIFPVVNVSAFDALPKARREKLIADGVIVMERRFSNPTYGRVTPKLF